jgi:molecular chaperone GrpE
VTSPKDGERESPGGHERPDATAEAASYAPGDNGPQAERADEPVNFGQALERIAALRAEIEEREAERKAVEDRYLRERAELENFKRRMQREKAEGMRYASEGLLRDLLPVVDNLERAVRAAEGSRSGESASGDAASAVIAGVEMVLRQLSETLERAGVVRVPSIDQPFDPAVHEALAQVESAEVPPGTVVAEHLPGYRFHDRLLRAAQVSVSKAASGLRN